jgi:hypothetical protein
MKSINRKPTRTIIKYNRVIADYTGNKWRDDETVRGLVASCTGRVSCGEPNMQNLPGSIANAVDKLAERGSITFRNHFKHSNN